MRSAAVALASAVLAACVNVEYVRPGPPLEPHAGQALVFGRIRFLHDGHEYFPWNPSLPSELIPGVERHFWLLRLDRRAVSAELHPDEDGSLAFRVAPGDYALVGNDEDVESMSDDREVVALLRIPGDGSVVYAGDLVFATVYHEGRGAQRGHFGPVKTERESTPTAAARLEAKYGPLPGPVRVSAWCVGPEIPGFTDADLAARAGRLLDRGCPNAP